MAAIQELRDAFEKRLGERLRDLVTTTEDALALKADRTVDLVLETFRDLGKRKGHEVAPLRKGVGEIGWELAWGKNLAPGYSVLSSASPEDIFRLELVLEASETSLRPGATPERAVEEVVNDLAKLLWTRAPLKVLVFGAHRDPEPASALHAFDAGISGIVESRDRDSDYLLVAFPNLEQRGHVAPQKAALWTKIVSRGKSEPARETPLSSLLGG